MALSAPLDIPGGGTGATTQLGALTNLGVPMGTVEEVVSGTGLAGGGSGTSVELRVGTVPLLNGGTGATNVAQARTNLQVWVSPIFTGVTRATAAIPIGDNNTDRVATTAWVQTQLSAFTPPSGGVDNGTYTPV